MACEVFLPIISWENSGDVAKVIHLNPQLITLIQKKHGYEILKNKKFKKPIRQFSIYLPSD